MKKVRFGIVGFGNIALHHALGIIWNKNASVYAVCDLNQERLDLAKEWGIKNVYKDYHDLVKDPDVDAVDICTHPGIRAEVAVAAAEAGKHIITEKPMCNSLAEADAMIDAAKRAHVKFMHAESYVFTRTHMEAMKLIDEGAIGKPVCIRENFGGWRARRSYFGDESNEYVYGHKWARQPRVWQAPETPDLHGGGEYPTPFDHGPHFFGLARYLMKNHSIEKVFAWSETITRKTPDGRIFTAKNTPVVTWRYKDSKNNCYGTWTRTNGLDNYGFKTFVTGTEGAIEVLGEGGGSYSAGYKVPPLILHQQGKTTYIRIEDRPDIMWLSDVNYYNGAHQNELDHFVECILEEKEPRWTGVDGKMDIRLTLTMIKSAMEEKSIDPMTLQRDWTAYGAMKKK